MGCRVDAESDSFGIDSPTFWMTSAFGAGTVFGTFPGIGRASTDNALPGRDDLAKPAI